MQKSYHFLIKKLNSFIREYYKNQIIRGFIYSLISLFIILITISSLESIAFFNSQIRTLLFWAYCILSGGIILKYIIIPVFKMFQLTESLSHQEAAKIIGTHFKEISDKLTNILELRELDSGNQQLINASIDQKIKKLELMPFNNAVDWSKTVYYSKYLIIPITITLILVTSGKEKIITESTSRIVNYNVSYEKPTPFKFVITNKTLQCIENSDFIIDVEISGYDVPKDVYIHFEETKQKLQKKSPTRFIYKFNNLSKNTSFFLAANDVKSKNYNIVILGRPIIENLEIDILPPSYTGAKKQENVNTGSFSAPEGSLIKWRVKSKKADSMYFKINEHVVYKSSKSNFFRIEKIITKSSEYSISLANSNLNFIDTVFYNIKIIKDKHPSISITNKDSLDGIYNFAQILIKDDYGFKDLKLHQRLYGLDRDTIIESQVKLPSKNNSQLLFEDISFNETIIYPGENIDWHFVLRDNDRPNGYKSTSSQIITMKTLSKEEIESQYNETNSQLKASIEEEIDLLKQVQNNLLEFEKTLIKKDSLDWRDEKKIEDILEQQQQIENRLNQLKKTAQNNFEKLNNKISPSQEVLKKQRELQKLFDDIMPEDMKKMYDELNKLKQSLNKNELQEQIKELQLSNEDIEKELDRNLELLKQFEFDEKLNQLIDKLNKLWKEQNKLSTEEMSDPDSLQTKNIQDFQNLKKEIQEMKEMNNKLENKQKITETSDLEKQIEEQLQEAKQKLENNNKKSAKKSQKKASNSIKELEEALTSMKKENKESKQEENIDVLRQILDNLVYFSVEQENIFLTFGLLESDDPQYVELMYKQQSLINSAKIIEDSLFALSKRVPQISSKINREINALNKKSLSTSSHLRERETPKAIESQQFIMTSANNLAVLLSLILEQLQKEMSSEMPSTQQCEKPGKGKPKPGDLKKLQKELSDQLKKLKEQIKNGEVNKKGKEGMSKQLVEMLAKQELIRSSLKEISSGIEDKETLDTLNEIIKNMEQAEEDIANNKITQELINRQAQIMSRMLEIDTAIQEQGEDDKRESQTATEYEKILQEAIKKYEQDKLKQAEMLKSIPPNLKEYYREKTNRYFNLIL